MVEHAGIVDHAADIERYRKPTRVLHWVHAGAFVVLFLTGLILFVTPLSILAVGSWTRLIHRIAAAVFVVAPAIYMPLNWEATWSSIKRAFIWRGKDVQWFKVAPLNYLLDRKLVIPPQEHMNSGQKLWWLMVIVFGPIFLVTGVINWFFAPVVPSAVVSWAHIFHNISFIATGTMLFIHIYLSVLDPLVIPGISCSFSAMATGKVTESYARTHHPKWYEEVCARAEKEE